MTDVWNMNLIRLVLLSFVCILCISGVYSQDTVPGVLEPQKPLTFNSEQPWLFQYVRTLDVEDFVPEKFVGMQPNIINDPTGSLEPFFDKVSRQINSRQGVVRVVHIGDSHVRGHFFPGQVKSGFEKLMGSATLMPGNGVFDYNSPGISFETGTPGIAYQVYGINGATAQKFCDPACISKISSLQPDLIIISFGTNEGYTRRYNSTQHLNQLDQLVRMLKESCPSAVFLFTTPPGAYMKYRGRYSVNTNTPKVAEVITGYAAGHDMAYWDLYNIVGGERNACRNWYDNNLMQRDRVHFTKSGYEIMGLLLFQAIIKSYNSYAGH